MCFVYCYSGLYRCIDNVVLNDFYYVGCCMLLVVFWGVGGEVEREVEGEGGEGGHRKLSLSGLVCCCVQVEYFAVCKPVCFSDYSDQQSTSLEETSTAEATVRGGQVLNSTHRFKPLKCPKQVTFLPYPLTGRRF